MTVGGHAPFEDEGPIVCVGASWGGLDAIRTLLAGLPRDLAAPVCIVQHRTEVDEVRELVHLLDRASALPVCEGEDKEPLRPGHAYLAPAGYHMLVNDGHLTLSVEDRVRWARPSIDVLFETAAAARGRQVTAVLLTGANDDGTCGARTVRSEGGTVIVQDPATALRPEMPAAAIRAGAADVVLPLEQIPGEVTRRVEG